MRTLKLGLLILLLGLHHSVTYSQQYLHTDKYDKQFKSAASRWLPGINYKWVKAQCWQESRFDRFAVSPVGAKGLCQFMPGTAIEVSKSLGIFNNPYSVKWSIEAASYYDGKLYRFRLSPRPQLDRIKLMLASYNAGAGNLHKAQKRCSMSVLYNDIIKCLPDITGHHSTETINYVRFIEKYRFQLNH